MSNPHKKNGGDIPKYACQETNNPAETPCGLLFVLSIRKIMERQQPSRCKTYRDTRAVWSVAIRQLDHFLGYLLSSDAVAEGQHRLFVVNVWWRLICQGQITTQIHLDFIQSAARATTYSQLFETFGRHRMRINLQWRKIRCLIQASVFPRAMSRSVTSARFCHQAIQLVVDKIGNATSVSKHRPSRICQCCWMRTRDLKYITEHGSANQYHPYYEEMEDPNEDAVETRPNAVLMANEYSTGRL